MEELFIGKEIIYFAVITKFRSDQKRSRWVGQVEHTGKKKNSHNLLVRKHERKRSLWRPKRRLENNITLNIKEMEMCSVDWNQLAQDVDQRRVVLNNTVWTNLWFFIKCGEFVDWLRNSKILRKESARYIIKGMLLFMPSPSQLNKSFWQQNKCFTIMNRQLSLHQSFTIMQN